MKYSTKENAMKYLSLAYILPCMLSLVLACVTSRTYAQERQISGIVTGSQQEPLPGVSVLAKGTTNGTTTNSEGRYTISVPSGSETLTFSFIGYATQDISIENRTEISISMQEDITSLDEVVVTALGISRETKSLGYAVQELSGSDLTSARETNVMNSLAGKIAGVFINRGTYGPGSSTRVVIRGERSIQGANQPLYVIDGIPVNNNTTGQPTEFNGSDSGDGMANINPDDIESISVLKGANAAALYGSRANNGVILITTKKGATSGRLGIDYSMSYAIDQPMYKIKRQREYAQGSGGNYSATDENSWGPRIAGQSVNDWNGNAYTLAGYDHVDAFLQNGNTLTNNLSFTGGNEKTQMRFSLGNMKSKGIIPQNDFNRTNITLRGTTKIANKFTVDTKLSYIYQKIENRPTGGEDASNVYGDALKMPVSIPVVLLENYSRPNASRTGEEQNFFQQNAITANPYWIVNKNQREEIRNRIIGVTTLNYEFNSHLSLFVRGGVDAFFDNGQRKIYAGTPSALANNSAAGDFSLTSGRTSEVNTDFLLTYKKPLAQDIDFTLSGGGNLRHFFTSNSTQNANGLDIANVFSVSNSRQQASTSYTQSRETIQSLYALGQFNFKNVVYLDLTARNDWSSTIFNPNNYFYSSGAVSAVLSDMIELPSAISFLKIRSSLAEVGSDGDPYQRNYLEASTGVNGTILRNGATLYPEEGLKPEKTISFESGADLRFLEGRLGLDFTYYKTNSRNQIIKIATPVSQGYQNRAINAGNIQNSGIELLLTGSPVKYSNFQWNVSVNYSRNRNKVIELSDNLKSYNIDGGNTRVATIRVEENKRLGEIYVRGFQRQNGRVVVGASGLPQVSSSLINIGYINPDWTGGITNSLTYKNFTLEFLIDGRFGGKVVSHTQAVLAGLGVADFTTAGREGGFTVDGVLADGTENSISVTAENYWQTIGGRGNPVGEAFAYDATNIRLRQASLGFSVPSGWLSGTPLRQINFSLYGRNLFFIEKDAPFDPEVALGNTLATQGVDFWSPPTTRSYGFNLQVSF